MRFATLVLLFASPAARGEDWPQFRGPNGDGMYPGKAAPTEWAEGKNVRWKTAVRGKGWSSPVVAGKHVWLTTATEDGKQKFAVRIDRKTGSVDLEVPLFPEDKPAFCHTFNSYATPTPVVSDGCVYVHFGSAGTACLDAESGNVIWERNDLKCDHFRGPASSPTRYDGKLFLLFDGFDLQYVVALDAATGKPVWKKDRNTKFPSKDGDNKKAYATPAVVMVDGKPQLVCPAAEVTTAYDPATGDELWRVTHGGMNGSARPVFGHGLMYLTNGHSGHLMAVKQGGTGTLGKDAVAWKLTREVPTRPSVILVKDHIYMVDDKGVASCVDAKTGVVAWKERLSGEFSASPVYAAGNVYFASQDGRTHVVAAAAEGFMPTAVNRLDGTFMASPAVADGELFLRTKTHLYCIVGK